MLGVNGVYRFSSLPLLRRLMWRYSSSKLFVGGLCYDTNEPVLKEAFEKHGDIIEVKVICDHKSGKSKGYGFVHFNSEDSASKALAELDGQKYPDSVCKQEITARKKDGPFLNMEVKEKD